MEPITVVTRPKITIVGMYIRTTMHTAMHDCSKLWHEEFGPRMASLCQDAGESYGVSWLVDEKTGAFDYWAAVPVQPGLPIPCGLSGTTLPDGLYAELAVPNLESLSAAYTRIFTEWLPRQRAYAVRHDAPSYELYLADHPATGKLTLYFPVIAVA